MILSFNHDHTTKFLFSSPCLVRFILDELSYVVWMKTIHVKTIQSTLRHCMKSQHIEDIFLSKML